MKRSRTLPACSWAARAAVVIVAALAPSDVSAGTPLAVLLECSRGPSRQTYHVTANVPDRVAQGERYTVRVDGGPSGTISHVGLRYIHEITTEFLVPAGTGYVSGSLRLVPGTGTANVASGARVEKRGNMLRLILPARVVSGTGYTAPSIELQLVATARPGDELSIQFQSSRVKANVFLVGDVVAACTPRPQPYTLATSTVAARRR